MSTSSRSDTTDDSIFDVEELLQIEARCREVPLSTIFCGFLVMETYVNIDVEKDDAWSVVFELLST